MLDFKAFAEESARDAFSRRQPTKPIASDVTHTKPAGTHPRYGYADCGVHVVNSGGRFVQTPDEIPTCAICRQLQDDDEDTMRKLGLIR